LNAGSITGGEGTLCQDKPITLHSTATDPAGHALTYAWKLNGAASGTNSPDFSFTPNSAGDYTVEVTITDSTNPPRTVSAGPVTLHVQAYVAPQITSISATPNQLSCAADPTGTHVANLSGQATGSACGGNLSYKWTVSEGSITNDTSPNATFDASTLSFQGAQGQSKVVTVTLTVNDETGKSATQTTNITVNCPPQFVRLSDVIFAKNSARVNNCGKRILIDEAAPRVAGGDYDIVLVGHRDTDEETNVPGAGRGRRRARGHALDEQRALNSAAVLIGDRNTCANVDPARIKIDWVGTDQTSTPQPGLCGTSSRPSQKERRGSRVTEADKNRRVEVYLVPRNGQTMPPAVKNIKPLPEGEVKALGCPK
jgi:outer membrane protein OmpA-like peptidoglycan-associated protein